MKYIFLALLILIQMSCATQNSSSNEDNTIQSLIQQNQPVYVEGKTLDEVIDFTTILASNQISHGIYQVSVNSSITFKNCIFKMPVKAFRTMDNGQAILTVFKENLTFIDCIFKEDVNFRGASIMGRTDFTKSTFNKKANFEELSCHQNAFFNTCIFEGELRFQNSFFNQKSNFMGAEFYGLASFQSSLFNSEFQCSATKFFKYADFTLIDCRDRTLFNYTEFRDKADFGHSIFAQDFDFVSTKNNTTSFDKSRFFGTTKFDKIEVSSSLSLKHTYFLFETPTIPVPKDKLVSSN